MKTMKWMILVVTVALLCLVPIVPTQAQSKENVGGNIILGVSSRGEQALGFGFEYELYRDQETSVFKTAVSKYKNDVTASLSIDAALFTGLDVGTYHIKQKSAPAGRIRNSRTITVEVTESKNRKRLEIITFENPTASVSGYVQARPNESVEGKAVQLELIGDAKTTLETVTDANGKYVFENVGPGYYHVSIKKDDRIKSGSLNKLVNVPQETDQDKLDIKVEPIYTYDDAVTITVLDEKTHQPLKNAEVVIKNSDDSVAINPSSLLGVTAEDGSVTFKDLPWEGARISVKDVEMSTTDADTLAVLKHGVVLGSPQHVTLKAAHKPATVDKHTLQVRVVNDTHNTILEPVELGLFLNDSSDTMIQKMTTEKGYVTFTNIPDGSYIVKQLAVPVEAGYYLYEDNNRIISFPEEEPDTEPLKLVIASKWKGLGFLKGTAGPNEHPKASDEHLGTTFAINYTGPSGLETTDIKKSDGSDYYQLKNLKPGKYKISATHSDVAFIPNSAQKIFEVSDNVHESNVSVVDILLSPTRVEVTTQNDSNEILPDAKYTVWKDGKHIKGAEIVQIGNKTIIDFLEPGTYHLRQEGVIEGHQPISIPQEFVVLDGVKQLTEVNVVNSKIKPDKAIKPDVETTEPDVETTEPVVDVTEPKVDVTEPKVDVTEPKVDVTEPKVDVTEPKVDITEPKVDITEPKVETTEPKVETTEPKVETTESLKTGDNDTIDVKSEATQTSESLPDTGLNNHLLITGAMITCLGCIALVIKKKQSLK